MGKKIFLLIVLFTLTGCNLANHGSFISSSYRQSQDGHHYRVLGPVEGKSCQTLVLYLLPYDEAISTQAAIKDALSQYSDAALLTNISIDDKRWYGLGYSVQCIRVNATAMELVPDRL